jgi:hypothetical protein
MARRILSLSVSTDTADALLALSIEREVSVSSILRDALQAYLPSIFGAEAAPSRPSSARVKEAVATFKRAARKQGLAFHCCENCNRGLVAEPFIHHADPVARPLDVAAVCDLCHAGGGPFPIKPFRERLKAPAMTRDEFVRDYTSIHGHPPTEQRIAALFA